MSEGSELLIPPAATGGWEFVLEMLGSGRHSGVSSTRPRLWPATPFRPDTEPC